MTDNYRDSGADHRVHEPERSAEDKIMRAGDLGRMAATEIEDGGRMLEAVMQVIRADFFQRPS
jgi:hypothetical protein